MSTVNTPYTASPGPALNPTGLQGASPWLAKLRVPVTISYNDRFGKEVTDVAKTELISPSGAMIEWSHSLSWGEELLVSLGHKEILARVVGQTSIGEHSYSYGISFLQEDQQFWGISFPSAGSIGDEMLALECCRCGNSHSSRINEIEAVVLRRNNLLRLRCFVCNDIGYWRIAEPVARLEQILEIRQSIAGVEHESNDRTLNTGRDPNLVAMAAMHDADFYKPAPRRERRRHKRVPLSKAKACIERVCAEPDIIDVVNVSKGGTCVRTMNFYAIGSRIRIACPYTIAGSNIFQSARIVRATTMDEFREYGIEYVRYA